MKELVEKIVRALVDYPEEVEVRELEATNVKILEIRVARQDARILIGRKGKNIDALKRIVTAAGKGKEYKEYRLDVFGEDRHPPRNSGPQYPPDRDAD